MKYQGKCFWVHHDKIITYEEGRELCSRNGGKPANIYSEEHFYLMMSYLAMYARRRGYSEAYLGMTFDSKVGIRI